MRMVVGLDISLDKIAVCTALAVDRACPMVSKYFGKEPAVTALGSIMGKS